MLFSVDVFSNLSKKLKNFIIKYLNLLNQIWIINFNFLKNFKFIISLPILYFILKIAKKFIIILNLDLII